MTYEMKKIRKNIMIYRPILLICIHLILLSTPSFANNEDNKIQLDPVIVMDQSEKQSYQTGDIIPEETTAFYTKIDQSTYEGQITTLPDILSIEPAIQIRQSGGMGSFATVSLRGSSSDQVMVYMDGILLNDASGGGVDLSNFSLEDIESVEIFKGIAPMQFSHASIGGVINLKTHRTKPGMNGRLSKGIGSFGTNTHSGLFNHKPGKWDYLLSFDHAECDNNFEIFNDYKTINPLDDQIEIKHNDQLQQVSVLSRFGIDFSDTVRLDISNLYFSKDKGLPNPINKESSTSYDIRRNSFYSKFTANQLGPVNVSMQMGVSRNAEYYDDPHNDIGSITGIGKQQFKYLTDSYSFNSYAEWISQYLITRWSVDFKYEDYSPIDLFYNDIQRDSQRVTFTSGIQSSLFLLNQRLLISPALRYYTLRNNFNGTYNPKTNQWIGNDITKNEFWSPQLGLRYQIIDGVNVKSSIGNYRREPSFLEQYGDRGMSIGNPNLKAEEGINMDAGFEINLKSPIPHINLFLCNAAWFRKDIDNYITPEPDSSGIIRYANHEGAKIDGFELSITSQFLTFFKITSNATWQNNLNLDKTFPVFYHKQLAGRYQHATMNRFEINAWGLMIYSEWFRESGMYYDSANLKSVPVKKEVNMGARFQWKSLMGSIDAKNIKNVIYDDYKSYHFFPQPGRTILYKITYKF